jgi:hypothetical protein
MLGPGVLTLVSELWTHRAYFRACLASLPLRVGGERPDGWRSVRGAW